jgi:predicted nuclease of restriction endonuclease-like (RecB) superfamily
MAKNPKKIDRKSSDQRSDIALWSAIRDLILEARRTVARGVNAALVWTNFEIGRRIVENEQRGKARADYAESTLRELAAKLTAEFGKGYSKSNLEYMRKFYLKYGKTQTLSGQSFDSPGHTATDKTATPSRISKKQISQTVSAKSSEDISDSSIEIVQTAFAQSGLTAKAQTVSGQSPVDRKFATVSRISPSVFPLSWSHYVFLMGIDDENERRFYEIESHNQNWSLRELRRQFNSSLYERLALSRDKKKVRDLGKQGQIVDKPEDLMKDPYVLEFLGLKEESVYSETDLETAIINRIEHFLLELGKGFLFEARQKRFTFDDRHFRVDLVFYNRILRCYVLIDLKIGELTHQDLGQMQMYVNYYDRFVKTHEENKTVGIILCKRKNDSLVEITLPEHSRVFARKYQLYLPTKAELKAQLDEKV